MSKRRRGYPSETKVKRGVRVVHGEKLLEEKLGRRDLCPCGSRRLFRACCLRSGRFRWRQSRRLLLETDEQTRVGRQYGARLSQRWSLTARRLPAKQF
jgi:hypothetical protein